MVVKHRGLDEEETTLGQHRERAREKRSMVYSRAQHLGTAS